MANQYVEDLLRGGLPEVLDLGTRSTSGGNSQQFVEREAPTDAQALSRQAPAFAPNPYLLGGLALAALVAVVAFRGK